MADFPSEEPEVAITVRNVGKCYNIYDNPKDKLKEALSFGRLCLHREFWALRDISLDVMKGETIGIVGRNGSGKSTLLQIICSTLSPTVGSVTMSGRVAALLELGSGFNPEFTGKENVYMNAAVLGFSTAEINEKYQAIVEFADIGEFINQPVKSYSSGMHMRLAFAVAINVNPDILVVDEALAVGDELFQRKCFARIRDFKQSGGTILFVSHSAGAVIELCDRAYLLDQGEAILSGIPKLVIAKYHQLCFAPQEERARIREEIRSLRALEEPQAPSDASKIQILKPGKRETGNRSAYFDPTLVPKSTIVYRPRGACIRSPRVTTPDGRIVNVLLRGEDYVYTYTVEFSETLYAVRPAMLIKTISGVELGGAVFPGNSSAIPSVEGGASIEVRFRFKCLLMPGIYFLNAGCEAVIDGVRTYAHRCIDIAAFRVQPEKDPIPTAVVDFCVEPEVEPGPRKRGTHSLAESG